ncbi:hypothetical protein [Zavarzinella formosa]|uniref:hypothetical protein n=1 Tax=Zavarzinella formosa TaxID=360055 RepID=UPI0003101DF1|nr:hypothetical protein [Zavarzinella formosa]
MNNNQGHWPVIGPQTTALATDAPVDSSPKNIPPTVRLRALMSRAKNHPRKTVADIYGLGKILLEAKELAPHGEFREWAAKAGVKPDDVKRATLAVRRIKAPLELLQHVAASCVRVLASPRVSASDTLTRQALSAGKGRNGLIGLRVMQSAVSDADPAAIHCLEPVREGPAEALGRQLLALSADETVDSIHITYDRDPEELPLVSVTILGRGPRRLVSRATIEEALARLTGEEQLKHCSRCDRDLTMVSFSKESHYCKTCERARVGEYTRKKRAANREAKKRIAEMGQPQRLVVAEAAMPPVVVSETPADPIAVDAAECSETCSETAVPNPFQTPSQPLLDSSDPT